MKKFCSMVLAMVIVFSMLPMPAAAKTTAEKVGENIAYEIYSYQWKNGTLYVQGCVANLNKKYDLLGMEDAVMVITDSEGLELTYINLNDAFEENCILRPESKRVYNFTVKELLYDAEEYSSLTSGLQVFFVSFSFAYEKCKGKNCGNCQNIGLDLDDNPFVEENTGYTGNRDSSRNDTPNCFFCNLSGKCSTCDGDGEYEVLAGSLWGSRCRTCEGSGVCTACNGDGIIGG